MTQERKARINLYTHEIDLTDLRIENAPRKEFQKEVEKIKYRGYEVESLADGRKILITKPGGKFTFGTIKREDFMVWIHNPIEGTLWLISHRNILEDLRKKGEVDAMATIQIIDALERVYNGESPDVVLQETQLKSLVGEPPEVLFKAYKWIWGQEDVNYPDGKGRAMSWEGLRKNKNGEWEKTGDGIVNVREALKNK